MKHSVIICLGSNIADRHSRIEHALNLLSEFATIDKESDEISTDDITGRGTPYLNRIVECTTNLEIDQLRIRIAEIETSEGRTPQSKDIGSMPIDIDIVLWDNEIVSNLDFNRPYFQQIYNTLKINNQTIHP